MGLNCLNCLNSMKKEDEAQIGRPTGSGEGRPIHSKHVPRFLAGVDLVG